MTEPYEWNLPRLKPTLQALGIVVVVLGLVFGAGYYYRGRVIGQTATQAEAQANRDGGQADAYKAQAKPLDAKIDGPDSARLAEARARLAKVEEENRALHASATASAPSGASIAPKPVPAVDDLAPVVTAQAEVIAALEAQNADLVLSRDMKDKIIAAQDRQIAGLYIALEAQKSLAKGALWKGRIQGLAVGAASGYIAGRLR